VVRGVVVADLAFCPFPALNPDMLSRANIGGCRNIGVPSIVTRHGLISHRPCLIYREDDIGHENLQGVQGRGSRACRGSDVVRIARRDRPGTDDTTCGASALRSLAS